LLRIRVVHRYGLVVWLPHHDPTTDPRDARHLRQRLAWVIQVHQHALGSTGVEHGVREVEVVGVAKQELRGTPQRQLADVLPPASRH